MIVPKVLLIIVASIFVTQPAFAQSNQATSTITLNHLNVQLTYPAQVLPGQFANINVTAQAKDSFQLTSLTLQVYLTDREDLRQLLSTTLAQNTMMQTGDQINKQVQVSVPSDAPRTSLVVQVNESANTSTSSYPYNANAPYWTGNYYPYPYLSWYGNGYYYSYMYAPSYYSSSYPSYYNQPTSDNAIAPLSYVAAPTPEYIALQSQYQQLQTQNQQLRQLLQTLQNSIAQKDSSIAQKDGTIHNLNNQLASAQGTTILLEVIAVILAIALAAVGALYFKSSRNADTETRTPSKTEEKTTTA